MSKVKLTFIELDLRLRPGHVPNDELLVNRIRSRNFKGPRTIKVSGSAIVHFSNNQKIIHAVDDNIKFKVDKTGRLIGITVINFGDTLSFM